MRINSGIMQYLSTGQQNVTNEAILISLSFDIIYSGSTA